MGKASILALVAVVGASLLACTGAAPPPATPTPTTPTSGDSGGGTEPTEPTPPPPQDIVMSWPISAAHFGDEATVLSQTTNRSAPYAWDRITADNKDTVSVSIGERDLPFTNTSAEPVFASDLSGAEWKVAAEVRAGAVELVLTADSGEMDSGSVESVTLLNQDPTGGSGQGYTSPATVTFSAPPPGGVTATGAVVMQSSVSGVSGCTIGSGYLTAPTVTFSAPPPGGTRATASTRLRPLTVTISNGGSGYTAAPTVTFSADVSGNRSTGTATISSGSVTSVTIDTNANGYTAAPTVTFSAPPSGTTAMGSVTSLGVGRTLMTSYGRGYTSAPTVTFSAPPSGVTATCSTAVMYSGVESVTITNPGSGYTAAPTVTFSSPPGGYGNHAATGTAQLAVTGFDRYRNLYWARRTLDGKQLEVRIEEG